MYVCVCVCVFWCVLVSVFIFLEDCQAQPKAAISLCDKPELSHGCSWRVRKMAKDSEELSDPKGDIDYNANKQTASKVEPRGR